MTGDPCPGLHGVHCGKPSLPGSNPFCGLHDPAVLVALRERLPAAADADFEREVPRG